MHSGHHLLPLHLLCDGSGGIFRLSDVCKYIKHQSGPDFFRCQIQNILYVVPSLDKNTPGKWGEAESDSRAEENRSFGSTR